MEAASLGLPAVNVGFRQQGRERARNVLDAEPSVNSILSKMKEATGPGFREMLSGMVNPYGDGLAAEKIVQVLTATPLSDELLVKRS